MMTIEAKDFCFVLRINFFILDSCISYIILLSNENEAHDDDVISVSFDIQNYCVQKTFGCANSREQKYELPMRN